MERESIDGSDIWSEWLLRQRFGGDRDYQQLVEHRVLEYVDRVLDHAQLRPAEAVVDLGTGTGVLAQRALARCGGDLQITQTDISPHLLQAAKLNAEKLGIVSRCRFLECSAESLSDIGDSTQDLVIARACIAYVKDKPAAFREMHRVLRPGGRISLAEPIRQADAFEASVLRQHLDAGGVTDRFLQLLHRWKSAQYPDSESARADTPLVNFCETDLLAFAQRAGFMPARLRYHVDVEPRLSNSWNVFVETVPYPGAPSLGDVMSETFSDDDRVFFEQHLRPTIESGSSREIDRVAYVIGSKPDN